MPDYRGNLDQAKFQPQYANQSTTGPNGDGEMQTWQNRPGLEESSAQQLARLLGADLAQVNYNGGPYSQQRPQFQLDFDTPNNHDAAMLASNYQNVPDFFNASLNAELASDRSKPVAIQEMEARAAAGQGAYMLPPPPKPTAPAPHPVPSPQPPQQPPPVSPPPTLPGAPIRPGEPSAPPPTSPGGPTTVPGPTWPAPPPTTVPGPKWPDAPPSTIPGPKWPDSPPSTIPGPIWQLPTLPGAPTAPAVVKAPTTGVANPGGFTSQPPYSGGFPMPIQLLLQQQAAAEQAAQQAGLLGRSYRSGGLLGGAY